MSTILSLIAAASLGVAGLLVVASCGKEASDKDEEDGELGGAPDNGELTEAMLADKTQTPPMGKSAITAWLAEAHYKKWACEESPHAQRSPSPHGLNRVCSNDLLAKFTLKTEYPVGSAGVKELIDDAGSVTGYAIYLKTKTGAGEGWYWYEDIGGRVVADGMGNEGAAKSVCVGCHAGAGSDAEHSGHDFVYTQVMPGEDPTQGDLTDAMMADKSQTPPMGRTAIEAWLTEGLYKAWKCEPAVHDNRSPSPHGQNRICSNKLLSEHGSGAYPVGAASVKELFDSSGTSLAGYAVLLKTKSAGGGESFYWYERLGSGVVADGLGSMGAAKSVCVSCHQGAGSDVQHSGHDFIYTQVQ